MKTNRKIVFTIFLFLIIPSLSGLIVQAPIPGSVNSFGDSEMYKEAEVAQAGPGTGTLIGNIDIPRRAVITNASFDVNTVPGDPGEYPYEVFIDIGGDKQYEWSFTGSGYGQLGQQQRFINNKTEMRVGFEGDEFNTSTVIRLPKNAKVESTMMLIDGRANVSGANPNKPWTKIRSKYSNKAIANITGGKIYFAEYSNGWMPSRYFEVYDPETQSWSRTSNAPHEIAEPGHALTVVGPDIYVMLRNWTSTWVPYLFIYHTNNDTWTDLGTLPNTNLANGGLTYDQGNYLYAVEHTWGSSSLHDFYRYSISAGTWKKMKSPLLNTPQYPTLCYQDGRVYFYNYTSGGVGRHFQCYTPNNDSWFRLKSAPASIVSRIESDSYNLFGVTRNRQICKYDVKTDTWAITGKKSSNFLGNTAGFAYSDRMFYLARYRTSTGSLATGYYEHLGLAGGDFPLNSTLNIGDNGGLPEWNITGIFDTQDYVDDFTTELNNLLNISSITYTDAYGNEFVDIPINITSNRSSEFAIREMFINYTYTQKVNLNPTTGNLVKSLNELVPDTGEGNISVPVLVYSSEFGRINISNISIDYYMPDLTNDCLKVLEGYGPGNKIVHADYIDYTFMVNVTNLAGYTDVNDVTLFLDIDSEDIQLHWSEATDTFSELRDPNDIVRLNNITSSSITDSVSRWTLAFKIRFNWTYANESLELCALNTTNDTGAWRFNYFEEVYQVENDLDLIGTLKVTGADQGVLIEDSKNNWVHANEPITWSNLKVVYQDTTDIYPNNKNFNVTITDDDSDTWMDTTSSGGNFTIITTSDSTTDPSDRHQIKITQIPGLGEDVSNWSYEIRVDNTPPGITSNIMCHADYPSDQRTEADDDTEIFVTWGVANDGSGSGVVEYAMEFNNPNPTQIQDNGVSVLGQEGLSKFYVRARDKVGNWGVTGSASIFIDLTNPTFGLASPVDDKWLTSRTVEFCIEIKDNSGSGVEYDSIQYRYVDEGNISRASWNKYYGPGSSGEYIDCKQNITFAFDGTNKKVQWRAQDLAGNGKIISNVYNLKIDSKTPTIKYIQPDYNLWLDTVTPTLKFYINDTSGSGLSVNDLKYSLSTTGPDGMSDWRVLDAQLNPAGDSALCTITPTLNEGDQNFIQISASDVAGNNVIFTEKRIKVDISGITFSEPLPSSDMWSHKKAVTCKITIKDDISSIDTTSFKYQISTNGTNDYSYWRVISIYTQHDDGESFIISTKVTFKEGTNNFIRWQATDIAGHTVESDHYRIKIDRDPIVFGKHIIEPDEQKWFKDNSIMCSISVQDHGGSGVDITSIKYSISTTGFTGFGQWVDEGLDIIETNDYPDEYTVTEIYIVTVTPTFTVGSENYIKWYGTDLAGNKYVVSDPIRINIDQSSVIFKDQEPTEDTVNDQREVLCLINIEDIGGSGVNPETVEYRFSNMDLSGFSDWQSEGINNQGFNIYFVYLEFSIGNKNHIQWRAGDIAGNNISESPIFNLSVNSPPNAGIKSPMDSKIFTNLDMITFDAGSSTDPDFSDKLTYYWTSNISKVIGDTKKFQRSLQPGVHNITLTVTDKAGYKSTEMIEIIVNIYESPDNNNTSGDITTDDDDSKKLKGNNDLFIIAGIIILVVLLLILFNFIKQRRIKKKKLEDDKKQLTDQKPAVIKSSTQLQSTNIQDGDLSKLSKSQLQTQQKQFQSQMQPQIPMQMPVQQQMPMQMPMMQMPMNQFQLQQQQFILQQMAMQRQQLQAQNQTSSPMPIQPKKKK